MGIVEARSRTTSSERVVMITHLFWLNYCDVIFVRSPLALFDIEGPINNSADSCTNVSHLDSSQAVIGTNLCKTTQYIAKSKLTKNEDLTIL